MNSYAGFWKRFGAIIIDGFILAIINTILSIIISKYVSILTYWIYFAVLESSSSQATFGKMVIGIIVTDKDGNKISFDRATVRHFCKIISGMLLCMGFILAGVTQKKQALHDLIANTLVVNK